MLGKLSQARREHEEWSTSYSIKLGITYSASGSFDVLEQTVKTWDNKSVNVDFTREENVYWLQLNKHWNSYSLEIKNSIILKCNKNDILKFST